MIRCLILVVVAFVPVVLATNPAHYHIGAVLTSPTNVNHFLKTIDDVNFEGDVLPEGVTLHGHSMLKQADAIEDTRVFCHQLMSNELSAVIIDDRTSPETIAYTASIHSIPIIGLANRRAIFSDKSLFSSYMRISSSYSHQADVWIQLLTHFDYECVHFIVSDSIDGRDIKIRFTSLADEHNLDIETIIEYDNQQPYIVDEIRAVNEKNSSCQVYALYADEHNAFELLSQISELNTSQSNQVWIVSEQALSSPNLPVGFLGVRFRDRDNLDAHITDSVQVIATAINAIHRQVNFTNPPTDCRNIANSRWLLGEILYDYLREQKIIFGKTGKVNFDERGDRLNGAYEILNQQSNAEGSLLVAVGLYHYNVTQMKMQISVERRVVWPGNQTMKPVGYALPSHLRIVTLAEVPFVWVLPSGRNGKCVSGQIPCSVTKRDPNQKPYEEVNCCEGYCIDLLQALAQQLNFTYSLYQVEDGLYGSYTYNRQTGHHEWTGLLGELYYDRADMVVAALTITPERSLAIDFTKPFKYQGITILQKRQSINRLRHPLTSFLQPFQNSLWVSVFVSVHVVALALYLLDRFSPFGRYKLPNCETITEEDALNLSSAIWFAWGVLFNSGIGEGTPRSFSGRVLGMIWAGFAMIVVASYTANLAAFLVLDRPETALTGINDPRLRNPYESFSYSTVRESSVDLYFRRQVELTPMYKRMSGNNFDNAEDAIAAVKSGSLTAFIWDSARLEFEAAKDCDLSISGEHFGRSGYAIGLPKNQNYWKDKVTLALLGMHEIGFMEDLDNKWILLNEKLCEVKGEHFPPTLGLKNMAGVFILVGTGILGGVGLIMFEIFYKQAQTRKQRRMELARNAVDKWKEMVENRKILIESMNMAARQRFKERHQVHRRREHLRGNSSKSFSEDRSTSVSSSAGTGTGYVDHYNNNVSSDEVQSPVKRPLEPSSSLATCTITTASATACSSRPRLDPSELHPRANTRIYKPNKPRLQREYSVAYDPDQSAEIQEPRSGKRPSYTHIV